MAEQFADHHLNIPRLSILGTDNSDLFHPQAASKGSQAQLPKEMSKHPGFARVFKPGKLTFGDVRQGLDPFVTLGYLAAKTKKIALGTAGIIAPLREPIHIAKAAATTLV
jgi:Coenzyme F420-dependent N5,N10-methylene tetrahydromethanopterin reductase and related flavin-dependent oxidoreductases